MGKRFIDTELNRKAMRGVDVKIRFAFDWLWANCDHAGVWQTDAELFKFEAGYKLDVQGLLKSCPRVEMLPNGNLFLLDFIGVNHGVLKPDYNPHKPVFRSLAANGIEPLTLEFQPLANPSSRVVVEVEVEDVVVDTQGSKERAIVFPAWATPEFMEKWALWKAYKVEKRSPYKPIGEQSALMKLAKDFPGEAEAIAAIENSMGQNYQGIFAANSNGKKVLTNDEYRDQVIAATEQRFGGK